MNHLDRISRCLVVVGLFCLSKPISGQVYNDYLGTGHFNQVRVNSSPVSPQHSNIATIDGEGIDSAYMKVQASRFLGQATLGANRTLIDQVARMGFEAWIDEQLSLPPTELMPALQNALDITERRCLESDAERFICEDVATDFSLKFNYGWFQALLTGEDLLRQRVALALSEIFVVSGLNQIEAPFGLVLSNYYDMLLSNAFGNFEDLLLDVTLNPAMGTYLSHFNNPKTDLALNIRPDENYAREIMQLFTIGLFELNMDGTLQLDPNGNPIPTYDNNDIKEMAKIFTGLGDGAIGGEFGSEPELFVVDFFLPMRMYEAQHEPGSKELLNGFIVPEGQSGMEDIAMAINHLFNHANTAPFISFRLIQRLVKSNPSPAFVQRVAQVFEDNGNGIRGDLGAVVKAILLDEEARDCQYLDDPSNGKLREPLIRYTHVLKALNASNETQRYWPTPFSFIAETRQLPLFAPSVFNFFLPDYQPNGAISENGLVAPEFQIHNTATSIGYFNLVNEWTFEFFPLEVGIEYEVLGQQVPESEWVRFRLQEFEAIQNNEVLLDELSLLLCHDQLSDPVKNIILTALDELQEFPEERVLLAIYLIVISPDYAIIR